MLLAKAQGVYAVVLDPSSSIAERGQGQFAVWLLHQSLSVVFLALVVVLFVVRKPVVGPRSSLRGALVAIAGTFSLTLLGSQPVGAQAWPIFVVASTLIAIGLVFTIVSLLTLGTCFGMFPEARGLVTRGPYSRVRHPVYLAEMVSAFGMILPILSPYTLAVYLLFVGLQYWRALNEERALEVSFPEYAEYRARTRRLVPWVH